MSDPQRNIVVVGGGIMGGDIAIAFSAGGWNVQVVSPSRDTRGLLPQRLAAGLGQLGVAEARRGALATHGALEDIDWARVDLVIEAVTEDLALKRDLFARIEALAGPDVPLASNTSNFQVGAIAQALKRRNRFLGTHFFMPAHLVPLVEVVSGAQTDPAVADSVGAVLGAIGKTPIRVRKDVPGFIANRIQHAMMREALYLIDEGVASAEDVDVAVRFGFGFRFVACGPIMQKEMSGWDTNCRAGSALYPHLHNEALYPEGIRRMVEEGRVGMKARRGFWDWTDESAAAQKARIERLLLAGLEIIRDDEGREAG
jgi:3-hydroxybutyryl-CoA dehydrogenase